MHTNPKPTRCPTSCAVPRTRVGKAQNIEEVTRCAQALFAEGGYEAISLRDIAQRAQFGLGTINFYFGNKESLFGAVVERVVFEINAHRLLLLEEAVRNRPDARPSLEQVLHAIVWPVVSRAFSTDPLERSVPRLVRWALVGPPAVEAGLRREFDNVSERMLDAILKSCPELAREEAVWGYSALIAMLYSRQLLDGRYLRFVDQGMQLAAHETGEACARYLVTFAAAGFTGLQRNAKHLRPTTH